VAILFGAINYEPDPARLPPILARLLRPGGRLLIAARNRVCPWEIAYNLVIHPAPALAFRRFHRDGAVTSLGRQTVRMRVYTPGELTRLFRPWFTRTSLRGLAVALPPYMITGFSRRLPRLERFLGRLEPVVSRLPVFRALGDHFLAAWVRR
jgi:SAM-dependent methyltransferase